jgi:hypothetical protein
METKLMPDLNTLLPRTFKLSDPVQLDGLRLGDIPA